MKILFVDTCHDVAGGQRSLIALLNNINEQIEYDIMIDKNNEKYFRELLSSGVVKQEQILFLNSKPGGVRLLGGINLFLTSLFKGKHYSLVHCNTFYDGLFSMPAFRILGRKTIFRARCGIDLSNHGIIDNLIYIFSSVILSNSDYVKETFKRVSSDLKKIITIYNPLDMKFSNKIKNEHMLSEYGQNDFVIAIIGAITEVKNQREVLEAINLTFDSNIKLKIIGEPRSTEHDKNYYNELLSFVKNNNLTDRVEFTGFVSDVRNFLDNVNLVCVPSDREPLGRVIFETQLYEIPVLASSSGGNIELIINEETGYLYDLGDIKGLSQQIIKIKNSNNIDSVIRNAKNFVLERFSPEKTYLNELSLYKNLVNKKDL